jgi:transcription antitermination factor NusG
MRRRLAALATVNLTGGSNPLITSKGKPSGVTRKSEMKRGDWVRVRKGPVEGAEGRVEKTEKMSETVTIIEIRQLNGNPIRLPRAYFEFAAFRENVVDTL